MVKTTGNGILIEFPSVVDAVRCAIDVQRGMVERNADVTEGGRIEFRVGINLGDIIIDGDDIYGDGVNIAARLEALADPGGIRISQTVLNHTRDKVFFEVEDAGEQALKNIARPVNVYRIAVASNALAGRLEQAQKILVRLRQLDPALRVSNLRERLGPYRRLEDVARLEEGLRKAGLPE